MGWTFFVVVACQTSNRNGDGLSHKTYSKSILSVVEYVAYTLYSCLNICGGLVGCHCVGSLCCFKRPHCVLQFSHVASLKREKLNSNSGKGVRWIVCYVPGEGDYIQYIMVCALETCSSGLCEKFNINHLWATIYHCTLSIGSSVSETRSVSLLDIRKENMKLHFSSMAILAQGPIIHKEEMHSRVELEWCTIQTNDISLQGNKTYIEMSSIPAPHLSVQEQRPLLEKTQRKKTERRTWSQPHATFTE